MSKYNHKKQKKLNKKFIFIPCALILIAIIVFFKLTRDDFKSAESAYFDRQYSRAMKEFTVLANSGNSEAQKYLGMMYYNGEGVSRDHEMAVKWLAKAAAQGNSRAQHYLAVCNLHGLGVPRDFRKALDLEMKAAATKQDFEKIHFPESTRYQDNNRPAVKNTKSAAEKVAQGKTKDDSGGMESLKMTRQLLEKFLGESEDGKAEAAYLLGLSYSDGKRFEPNSKEALKWFHKSASEGNASAQTSLGMIYFFGNGVLQDFAEAAHWFSQAAQQGSKNAQFFLGNLYASGFGVPPDYTKAAALYAAAVQNGHSLAKCYLAELFSKGVGVYQNADIARILCQEGYKETGNETCAVIWDVNMLGKTDRPFPSL